MSRNILTAIDIGTSTVQTVVAQASKGEGLRVLGVGVSPSAGVRRGVVVDYEDAAQAIKESVDEARKTAGNIPFKSVWVGVGGTHVSVSSSRGVVAVSRADGEISPEDVRRAIAAAETFVAKNPNKSILHIIPRDFKVDHESGIKNPVGMHGVRLEVDTLIVECSSSLLKNLVKAIEGAGLQVEDYVFGPLAASEAILSKRQKELGVMLLDIGGGTASFVVFEEGVPIHAGVIPIGGNLITNDVAIGFRTHVDVAERIKVEHGSCRPEDLAKKEVIRLAHFIPQESSSYTRKELAEIIEARMRDVLELLVKELKKIERAQLLPAGVVIVGGSSLTPGMVELAKQEIRLPVELGTIQSIESVDEKIAPSFATVLGILQWGYGKGYSLKDSGWKDRVSDIQKASWMKWLRSLIP